MSEEIKDVPTVDQKSVLLKENDAHIATLGVHLASIKNSEAQIDIIWDRMKAIKLEIDKLNIPVEPTPQ